MSNVSEFQEGDLVNIAATQRRLTRWISVLAFAALSAVFLLKPIILPAAGRILVKDDRIVPADVIVVPTWADSAGALEAADLFHRGFASNVYVISDSVDAAKRELLRRGVKAGQEEWTIQILKELGVSSVEKIPNSAEGTEAEGRVLGAWCKANSIRSMIVVSTTDHSRRLHRVMERSITPEMSVMIRNATYSSFYPNKWWQTRDGIRTEIEEMEKLLMDLALHPVR